MNGISPITEQIWGREVPPLLSIACITYNHERFIRDTIEGFLLQQTTFKVEILIHDDASIDATQSIIKEYQEKYPGLIFPTLQTKNQFSQSGLEFSFRELERAKGKYIALCEGDDYWTDSLKLQTQVMFLEQNPGFSMSFHEAAIVSENLDFPLQWHKPKSDVLDISKIILKHYIPTCSLVFRNDHFPKPYPDWIFKGILGDIPIQIILASHGPAKFFPSKMSVYRKHVGGITMDKERQKKVRRGYIRIYRFLNKHLQYRYFYLFSFLILKHFMAGIKDKLRP